MGWCVGPPAIIEKLKIYTETSVQAPSGLSQAILFSLLQAWGHEGLDMQVGRTLVDLGVNV